MASSMQNGASSFENRLAELHAELSLSEENCRRGAKEGLLLIEQNSQLMHELEILRASLEKVQTEKSQVEKLLKQAQRSQHILSDIGDEQENSLLEAASQATENLQHQLASLQNDNKKLQSDYARIIERLAAIESDYAVLLDESNELRRKHTETRTELQELKRNDRYMQKENAELQTENVALQSQLVGLKQRQVEFESMKVEVKQLLDEKDVLDAELHDMQMLFEMLQTQNTELMKSVENERELRQALKRELDAREMEEQSRLNMEALSAQYGAAGISAPLGAIEKELLMNSRESEERVSPTDGGDGESSHNVSGLSLFAELEQQQSAADKAEEARKLSDDLHAAREELSKTEKEFDTVKQKTKSALTQLLELSHVESASTTTTSSGFCHDFQNIIEHILKELSTMNPDSNPTTTTGVVGPKLYDLQSLRQAKLQCETLSAKCAKLEANSTAGSDDVVMLIDVLKQKQIAINGAIEMSNKMLARFDASSPAETGNTPTSFLLRSRLIPALKSSFAIKAAERSIDDDVEESDAGQIFEKLDKKFEVFLSKNSASVALAAEPVAPTDPAPSLAAAAADVAKQLDESVAENAGLKSLLTTQREQIHSLRESLKTTQQTAEHSLMSLKSKYDGDKEQTRENLAKLRLELNQRKEDATTFSSIRSMLNARCADYVTQTETLQRKLKTSEQEKQTLSGLVHLAIRQKLSLIERIQELESHLDAVSLNQANDADAAHAAGGNWRGGGGGRRQAPNASNSSNGNSNRNARNFDGISNSVGQPGARRTNNGAGANDGRAPKRHH